MTEEQKPHEWAVVHDFLYGYGYWNPATEQRVFVGQVKHHLDKELYIEAPYENHRALDSAKVQQLYDELQPHLEAEAQRRREYYEKNPPKFDKISLPLVKKPWPKL